MAALIIMIAQFKQRKGKYKINISSDVTSVAVARNSLSVSKSDWKNCLEFEFQVVLRQQHHPTGHLHWWDAFFKWQSGSWGNMLSKGDATLWPIGFFAFLARLEWTGPCLTKGFRAAGERCFFLSSVEFLLASFNICSTMIWLETFAADGTAVASARRFLTLSLAISLLFVIFSLWSHLQNFNRQEVCVATLVLCTLHLLQKYLIPLALDIAKWKKRTKMGRM